MLLCRCHYSLGALYELEEESLSAEEEYRLALMALMDADEMDEELTLQGDIHYLKGESMRDNLAYFIPPSNTSKHNTMLQRYSDQIWSLKITCIDC